MNIARFFRQLRSAQQISNDLRDRRKPQARDISELGLPADFVDRFKF